MGAFFLSFLFGLLEMFLLQRLITALTAGNRKVMLLYLLAKTVTYAAGITLFVTRYLDLWIYCFCGFGVGLPIGAIGCFIYLSFFKKR